MSSYTSGNKAPTLERQHAVKVGNMDGKKPIFMFAAGRPGEAECVSVAEPARAT